MENFDKLKDSIKKSIKPNGQGEITGQVLQDTMLDIINTAERVILTKANSTNVTYTELKALRENSELVSGHLYRITDYEFTTVQDYTKSAGHLFDIIVLAISESELSHLARAIAHEGDTYFDGNDLGAWELWYDLDNDATKYEWADAKNGKGVIYRMIDEKRNDCPYDFKNTLFYDSRLGMYHYTFSYIIRNFVYDGTVDRQITNCYSNSMKVYSEFGKQRINHNVFLNISFNSECYSNTFGDNCRSNFFGSDCYGNTFGDKCYGNTFGDNCSSNTFGIYCYGNVFGSDCYGNTFGDKCYGNTFGDALSKRTLNGGKTLITLNDEYYDDGSGQLVPVKHPDLSTQPSILPYKFMGQYVYEQLIPNNKGLVDYSINSLAVSDPLIIGITSISRGIKVEDSSNIEPFWFIKNDKLYIQTIGISGSIAVEYFRIVYTSMPEDANYYEYTPKHNLIIYPPEGTEEIKMSTDYSGNTKSLPSENGYFYSDDDFNSWFDSEINLIFTPTLGASDYATTTDSVGKSIETTLNISGILTVLHSQGQQPFVVRF